MFREMFIYSRRSLIPCTNIYDPLTYSFIRGYLIRDAIMFSVYIGLSVRLKTYRNRLRAIRARKRDFPLKSLT